MHANHLAATSGSTENSVLTAYKALLEQVQRNLLELVSNWSGGLTPLQSSQARQIVNDVLLSHVADDERATVLEALSNRLPPGLSWEIAKLRGDLL